MRKNCPLLGAMLVKLPPGQGSKCAVNNLRKTGQIMTRQFIFGLVLGAATIVGCGSPPAAETETSEVMVEAQPTDEEVAAETLQRMLEAATSGDWETYVDQYYGERHKFRSSDDRDALVKRFQEKWGEKLVPGLSRATQLPVQIDGDKAMFQDGDETVFVLYRGDAGSWKFHL